MFVGVAADVLDSSAWRNTLILHDRVLAAAIDTVTAAGLRAIVVELSPHVATCM